MSEEKIEIDKFDLFVENCPACESETCEKIMYVDGNYPKVDCEYHFCNLYGKKKKECGEIKDCIIKNTIKQLQTAKEENELLKSNDCEKCENSENKNIHCWDCLCAKLNIVKQQNKQMRENINNIKNLCNEDWEDMTVDKFQNQLLQAFKEVNNEK